MSDTLPTRYRMQQLGPPDAGGIQRNIAVSDLDSLVTHHPRANQAARLVDGVPDAVENARFRSYAVIGGELQEVQALRTDRQYRSLDTDQVLLIKDFILDDMTAADTRRVDVPAPVAGVIGRVDVRNGVVDINAPTDDRLIARIRHLGPIAVAVGDTVAYGQSLGTQNNIGLPRTAGRHVHIEMDTSHYQQLDHYIRDLAEGRLPVQAMHRLGVVPRAVVDDGVARVGETGARVVAVQRALVAGGYRAVGDVPIEPDGVYRLSMQGAVLRFQRDHGIAESGDLCAPTWRAALDATLGRPILPPAVVDHPEASLPEGQQRLLQQIRGQLGALDAARPRTTGADGDRFAHGLLRLADAEGLHSVDHVLSSVATADAPAGARVFLVEGRLEDPAHRRVSMPMVDVLALGSEERAHGYAGVGDAHRPRAATPNPGPVMDAGLQLRPTGI